LSTGRRWISDGWPRTERRHGECGAADTALVDTLLAECAEVWVSCRITPPLMSGVADPFGAYLRQRRFGTPHGRVISTLTARVIEPDTDLRALLTEQMTAPVRFTEALSAADVDLWIEVGPWHSGRGLLRWCQLEDAVRASDAYPPPGPSPT
jgi:hypothetical protein